MLTIELYAFESFSKFTFLFILKLLSVSYNCNLKINRNICDMIVFVIQYLFIYVQRCSVSATIDFEIGLSMDIVGKKQERADIKLKYKETKPGQFVNCFSHYLFNFFISHFPLSTSLFMFL